METQAVNVKSFLFSRNVLKYISQIITCYNWMLDNAKTVLVCGPWSVFLNPSYDEGVFALLCNL